MIDLVASNEQWQTQRWWELNRYCTDHICRGVKQREVTKRLWLLQWKHMRRLETKVFFWVMSGKKVNGKTFWAPKMSAGLPFAYCRWIHHALCFFSILRKGKRGHQWAVCFIEVASMVFHELTNSADSSCPYVVDIFCLFDAGVIKINFVLSLQILPTPSCTVYTWHYISFFPNLHETTFSQSWVKTSSKIFG